MHHHWRIPKTSAVGKEINTYREYEKFSFYLICFSFSHSLLLFSKKKIPFSIQSQSQLDPLAKYENVS